MPRDKPVGGVVNLGRAGVVDVVHHQIAPIARNDALPVGGTAGRGGEYGHAAVAVTEGDALLHIDPRRALHAGRSHRLDLRAEEREGEVDRIDPQVEQRPAAQLRPDNPLLVGDSIAEVGRQHPRPAHHTVADQFGDRRREGHVARPDGLAEEYAPLLGEADERLGLGGVGRESLLAKDGFAAFEAHPRLGIVVRMGRSDVDEVHVGISRQLPVGAVRPREAVFAGECRGLRPVARSDRIGFHPLHSAQRARHLHRNVPGAENAHSESFHRMFVLGQK